MEIKIGLYKHRKTGQFDVMINQVDKTFTCHNGEFDLVKDFNYYEETKEEKLKKELGSLQTELKWRFENDLTFVFKQGKSFNYLDDKKINGLRETLYNFMCKRRELLNITEFKYEGDSE